MSTLVGQRLSQFLVDLFLMHGLRVDMGVHAMLKHFSKNMQFKSTGFELQSHFDLLLSVCR